MQNLDNNKTELGEQLTDLHKKTIIDALKQLEGVKKKLLSLVKK